MLTATAVLDNYYLEVRCMLLEIAATLDRLDRAVEQEGDPTAKNDPRLARLQVALEMLADKELGANRSEQVLLHFSDLD
jgi:hypothetical protein